jgi:hypothetical protein
MAHRDGFPVPHRLTRAVFAAAAAVAVGAGAHVLAGNAIPPGGLAAAVVLLTGPAWVLAARERRWLALTGIQLGGQQAVHALLPLGAVDSASPGHLPQDVTLYGHLLAAALMAGWLRCGERRAWAAARRAARAIAEWCLQLCRPTQPGPASHIPAAAPDPLLPCVPDALHHVLVRRGPPLPAA